MVSIFIVIEPGGGASFARGAATLTNRTSGRKTSALMRTSAMTSLGEPSYGMPVMWCPRGERIEVWPIPDQDYELLIRGRDGMMIDSAQSKPVAMLPVADYVRAANAAHDQQQRRMTDPVRVERFTLLGEE